MGGDWCVWEKCLKLKKLWGKNLQVEVLTLDLGGGVLPGETVGARGSVSWKKMVSILGRFTSRGQKFKMAEKQNDHHT